MLFDDPLRMNRVPEAKFPLLLKKIVAHQLAQATHAKARGAAVFTEDEARSYTQTQQTSNAGGGGRPRIQSQGRIDPHSGSSLRRRSPSLLF